MIQLPTLAGVPPELSPPKIDPIAARCALALLPDGPVSGSLTRKMAFEHAVLQRELEAWHARATAGFEIFDPRVHVLLNKAPHCGCAIDSPERFSIWLGNRDGEPWASRWRLDRRFHEINRQQPGMAQTVLNAICHANPVGIPVLTPREALSMACFTWWMGEVDERTAVGEWMEVESMNEDVSEEELQKRVEEERGIPTRKWWDKQLPLEVTEMKGVIRIQPLERLAENRGELGDLARLTLQLWRDVRTLSRDKSYLELHRNEDDMICMGFGATLRWNVRDPMPRVYDDYANGWYESHHVEESYGWLVLEGPGQLRAALASLEKRFAIARQVEALIKLIAERSRE